MPHLLLGSKLFCTTNANLICFLSCYNPAMSCYDPLKTQNSKCISLSSRYPYLYGLALLALPLRPYPYGLTLTALPLPQTPNLDQWDACSTTAEEGEKNGTSQFTWTKKKTKKTIWTTLENNDGRVGIERKTQVFSSESSENPNFLAECGRAPKLEIKRSTLLATSIYAISCIRSKKKHRSFHALK